MLVDQRRSRPDLSHHRVTVLGTFTVTTHGDPVPLGVDSGRAVAYLAVHRRPQRRADLAADLFPGVSGAAAQRLLDEAITDAQAAGLLHDDPATGTLRLGSTVVVDLDEAMALVRTLADGAGRPDAVPADLPVATALLSADLLPDEPAPWLAVERERFRQIRLNALEELSAALSAAGRHAEAIALAEETVRTSPSRESARRALIEAHLAQGDIAEAVAQYDEYQELLRSSVGGPTAFGLDGLLPPVPAWPVLRVNRSMQRVGMTPPGMRAVRPASRRLVSGGSVPSTPR
jgi:DNA-binding SARP family transcriptional activator